ncbi:MAG: metal-sensing transcriptional repressor [Spirochaetaceae bacterium]|nr:metal-sensing transcriptional repressor [Spirochaetaceae bacterium]
MENLDELNCTKECSTCKKKLRDPQEYKSLINRLNRIQGQLRGITGMVENNIYCVDILTQVASVQAALKGFCTELLSSHIKTCVVKDIRNNNEESIDELLSILRKFM